MCAFAQLPEEGFEGSWPPTGWTIDNNGIGPAASWTQSALGNPLQPPYEGDYAAYINKENVASGIPEDWLITPQFTMPDNPQLRFFSRLTQPGDQGSLYRIMVTTGDPTDLSSYDQIQEWAEFDINPIQDDYSEKVVDIPGTYVGQSVYVAFVMLGDNGDRWLVDNVKVVEQCLPPTDLGVDNVGLDAADLTWNNPSGASSFEIEFLAAADIPTGNGEVYNGVPPYNVDELDENTEYKFYVKTLCDDGGESEWEGPFYFSTVALGATCEAAIEIAALPYSTTDNTSTYGDDYSGSPGASGCGSTFGYLNGDDVVYEYTATDDGTISIDMTENGSYSGMFVYESCDDIGVSCVAGGVGGFAGDPVSIPDFAVTAGQTYYIVISTWASPQTTPYTLTIQQVFCAPPEELPTTNIGQTSADLSWTNPSGATAWEVVVQAPGSGIPTGAGLTATTNTNYEAGGLTPATPYEYYVRADCGDGTFSAWAGPFLFNTTICEPADQCTYTFVMVDSFGDGWNGNTMTVSQNGITIATLTGPTNADNQNPVSVTVEVCNNLPLQLFWNAGGSFAAEVGVSVQNSFAQTIFEKAPGEGTQNSLLYEGDVDCDTPACLPPENLTVTDISTDQVQLGWGGPATGEWEYFIVEAGSPAPTDADSGTYTDTNPVVATGLTAGTNYEYYVRTICVGDPDPSGWSDSFSFTTALCELTDQCVYEFIMVDSFGDGWNGNTMTVTQNGATIATLTGPTNADDQNPVTVQISVCNNEPLELFWNAGGAFAGEVGISIVNNFDQTLFNKPPGEGSQNTMLYEGTVDCDNPACLPPENLSADNITTTTADLSWTPATGEWEYYIVEEGEAAPTDADSGTFTDVVPTEATGLTAATNYEYYVRTVCDVDEYSVWAGPFAFSTEVCEPEDQCVYVFEMTSQFWGWNGNTMTISQGGVELATIGPGFTGTGPETVEISMCPDVEFTIFWNSGGFAGNEIGLTVYTPFAEDVYTKPFGVNTPNTLLYTGMGNCTPPACPKPQDLAVDATTTDSATLSWTEMGSADTWEVWVLPPGSPEPTEPGTVTGDNPYIAENLEAGTPYIYYVRANCGDEDGYSTWSGPFSFVTELENDDCDGAVDVPVNPDAECVDFVSGTLTGSTGSGVDLSCVTWMDIEYDAWFSFVAETGTHSVTVNNQVGATFNVAVFEGDDCGTLTELSCGGNSETITGLTPGETYYVMVYTTFFSDPTAVTSFDVCIKTPVPPITVNDTEYTMEELVQDVLIGIDCAIVSNVEAVSGSDFGQASSIGYFDQNGSTFPFTNGIVMATGGITEAPGPWPGNATFDNTGWPGDADLSAIIAEGGNTGPLNNASVLEFDFVPFIDEISFNFLFASSEYGTFQCTFSDAFAFILTGPTTAVDGDNLAVIPGTTIPVSVVNIRDEAYNGNCDSQNPDYFAQYNPDNPEASPIGYNGQTQVMQAQASVTPGETYHIKLVIADYNDSAVNSAVFLDGGSFAIGAPDLGSDLTIEGGNAACAGEEIVLDTQMDPDTYDFTWYQGDDELVGETGPSLTVTEGGTYTVEVLYENTECSVETSKTIEYYDPIEEITGDPEDLTICDASGFGEFDLSVNDTPILDGSDTPEDYEITYYLTEEDAETASNAIGAIYTNEEQYQQTIYVRIENIESGCFGIKQFDLIVQDLTPEFDITEDFSLCEGTTGTIEITATNYDPDSPNVSYTWTLNDGPLPDTTSTITVEDEGVYEVTINNTGCEATATVTVTVTPTPVADAPADVTECNNYTLPALSANNNYYTGPDGTGDMLAAGDVISSTQTIYVLADSGTEPSCTDENSFVVTIVDGPEVVTPGDQTACDSYTLPTLDEGDYYTDVNGPDGTGTMLNAGDEITTTQTIYVYAATGGGLCPGEESFEVTIIDSPVAQVLPDVTECDVYELPALDPDNNYYTGPDGTGDMLAAGDLITTTQTIYILADTDPISACTGESEFVVTITPSPDFNLGGPYATCVASSATISVNANNFDTANATYAWTVNGVASAETGSSIQGTEFGTYEVTVTVNNCSATESVALTQDTAAVAIMFEEGCEDGIYMVNVMDIDGSFNPDTASYAWTGPNGFSETTQEVVIPEAGDYTVTVTTEDGCIGSTVVNVIDTSCSIPRGISPNNDDMNDTFDLTSLGVTQISIFNRYGAEVFSYGAYTDQWHGQSSSGDELPTGTYFYSIKRANGESKTGWVYINREQ
ncbi:hypothetical protein GCM10007424_28420 [Flavobacterium suaedae]|uniref:T9SS type B sorting domain-containing protein n=1 Tax=Flavobacterium suaedae TaxID=1767027 RepID=A0ABQ1K373_9FLAO|nr:hypothetical protein GCM10007424_28420 [Flavobacterium suaedae]